jgi:hypothetical protein
MDKHFEVASMHRVFAWFFLGLGVVLGAALFFTDSSYISVVGVVSLMGLLALLHRVISVGAEDCRPWARKATLVVGAVYLPGIPVGTLIGGLLIYLSIDPWESGLDRKA